MDSGSSVNIPGYVVEQELGRGGMAVVYSAMQESVERRVALKVMSRVLLVDTSFSERFMREAKIAANLYHPHIVAVHDVGVFDDQHYIAMEYLSGGDLAVRCGDNIQLVSTVRVVREIASALHYAHSKGFVHRDVKPENILFREDGGAVLTDFGIARAVNSATQMTKTGAVVGTPQYMSPEQARGKDLDGRSDLYGLGIVFYEMLMGRVPFEGSDSVAVGIQHVTEPVPRLSEKLHYIQPVLERFLAKHPDDRYQSGGEALVDLQALEQRLLSGEMPAVAGEMGSDRVTRISNPPVGNDLPPMKALDETRAMETPAVNPASADPSAAPAAPTPRAPATPLAATPRPDGSVRQEPRLGSMDDLSSFDRTVHQPQYKPTQISATRQDSKRSGWWLAALVLLVGAAATAWWQQDRLREFMPNQDVDRWLAQAEQAGDFGRWYGESSDFANVLYERVLAAEPGNRRALAGQELVALYLCDQAEQAMADGNTGQAQLLLSKAREIAPLLPRITELVGKLNGPGDGSGAEEVSQSIAQTNGQETASQDQDRRREQLETINALLQQAQQHLDAGRLVRPANSSALSAFEQVLELEPNQAGALAGRADIEGRLTRALEQALAAENTSEADSALQKLVLVSQDAEMLNGARQQITQLRDAAQNRERAQQVRNDRIAQMLSEGNRFVSQDQLSEPPGENAINRYRGVLRADPGNQQARDGLAKVARRFLALTELALEEDRLESAATMIGLIEDLDPSLGGLGRAKRRLEIYSEQNALNDNLSADQLSQVDTLLSQAADALSNGLLMQPPGSSAFDSFRAVQRLQPDNAEAQLGISQVSIRLAERARSQLSSGDLNEAVASFLDSEQINPSNDQLPRVRADLGAALRDAARVAIDAGRLDDAGVWLTRASDVQPDHPDLDALQLQLSIANE
ncbi:MAG: protein kinase [Lysobacterales bacterium]